MPSFGDRLQREREMRSISLEEISAATKISSRNLRALEEEKFDELPGGIFNKGFVRNYARFLGIDEERAVSDYISAENEFRSKRLKAAVASGIVPADELYGTNQEQKQESRKHSAGFRTAALILILVLVSGGITWKLLWSGGANADRPASPINVQANTPAPHTQSQSTQLAPAVETSAAKTLPETQPPAATSAVTRQPAPEEKAAPERMSLHLKANQDSWVQVTADGKVLLQEVLASGSDRSFQANKQIVLKLGNAAGVQVSYNGKALPSFSPDVRVKTLTFSSTSSDQSNP